MKALAQVAKDNKKLTDGQVILSLNGNPILRQDFTATMALLRNESFQKLLRDYPRPKRSFIVAYEAEDTVSSEWRVRDLDEVSRREQLWTEALEALEYESGRQGAAMEAGEFRRMIASHLDLRAFRQRHR